MAGKLLIEGPWYATPCAIYDQGLGPLELAVYGYLARCASGGVGAWPSYTTIARCCGISRRSAVTVVQRLRDKGLIDVETRKGLLGYTSNLYRLLAL
ncbi:MAG: helix-turn-helix domain-containing protein [Veillonellaceae bacterium]|nr:helix-turn-helix domain-containing protein [Veillonellaceae bacterium]